MLRVVMLTPVLTIIRLKLQNTCMLYNFLLILKNEIRMNKSP